MEKLGKVIFESLLEVSPMKLVMKYSAQMQAAHNHCIIKPSTVHELEHVFRMVDLLNIVHLPGASFLASASSDRLTILGID